MRTRYSITQTISLRQHINMIKLHKKRTESLLSLLSTQYWSNTAYIGIALLGILVIEKINTLPILF